MAVRAAVTLDTDGAHVGEEDDGELPDVPVQSGGDSSARAIASASRNTPSRSSVTSPTIRIDRPGPGNGWRHTMSCGQAELLAHLAGPRP